MQKPPSLRAFLTAAVPHFARNPSALLMHVTAGNIATRMGQNLGYEYRYTLSITILEYSDHPDTIFFPLAHWLRTHQPDLLLNHQKGDEALKFEVDIIDAQTSDIAIEMQLDECVDVLLQDDGRYRMTHRPEPDVVGTEGLSGMGTLPDGVRLMVTPYGEYVLAADGSVLMPPQA